MSVSEEYKITAGTISGATLKSIDIEPSIIVDGKSYTASEFNKAVEMLKQPQLNENQQIVVNDVKQDHENYGIPKFSAIHLAFTTYATGYYKDHLKNDEEFYQVLSTLIAWAQEQEE